MSNKIERFTQQARRVLNLAQEEAVRMQHTYIDTEHLLIGLVRQRDGVAAQSLHKLGLEVANVVTAVEAINPPEPVRSHPQVELADGTKKALEYAVHEARRMGSDHVDTEHLLLGLVRQTTGNALLTFKRLGVSTENVRREVRHVLRENSLKVAAETETTETAQVPETSPETIIKLLEQGDITPEQAAQMIEQSTARRLLTIQMSVLDLIQTGKATAQQATELIKPLHLPLSPLFIGVDLARSLRFTVTADDGEDAEFTLTAAQFQEIAQHIISSLRAGKNGSTLNRQWTDGQHIEVEVENKHGGEKPSEGV
ncbi:MAG: Clp protease N-terminal domain-containing protein [Anaerolineae bacterium]